MRLRFGEVFGHSVSDKSPAAKKCRSQKLCPFRNDVCNKDSIKDPLGVCSLADENQLTVTCPNRFLENDVIFKDAAKLAFPKKSNIAIISEVGLLKNPGTGKRQGKVDFVLARLSPEKEIVDYAALEVQSVYISGYSIKPAFKEFLASGKLPESAKSRADYRSSIKRLVFQLNQKVPVFRRWGKKVFVAVDELFFEQIPKFQHSTEFENSEITWLIYPFSKSGISYHLGKHRIVYSEWDRVQNSLGVGQPPTPSEFSDLLTSKLSKTAHQMRI